MRRSAFTLALATAALAACGPSASTMRKTTQDQHTQYTEGWKKYGEPKAVFDLNCPADQITITELNEYASSIGVRGCGQQARYEWAESVGWVMDAASHRSPTQSPTAPGELSAATK